MAKPILVGSLSFPSKKAAKDYFRAIRDSYKDGERILGDHDTRLRELIAIHHEAEAKIGPGISHFTVETESTFGRTRHFVIHRTIGEPTDVSFISAIDGKNERRDRFESLRRAIELQIVSFRNLCFQTHERPECSISGVPLTQSTSHVDHIPPSTFQALAEEWLELEEISLSQISITPSADNQIVTEMTDLAEIKSWQEFHQNNAKLRLLSPLANLSDAKKLDSSTDHCSLGTFP